MGMFHVYLLVMFSCVLYVRSCTPGGGSSCTSRVTLGGKLMLVNGNYNLSNKRIVLRLPPSTQRKFQNTWTSGIKIIHLRRGKPYCEDNGNMGNSCPQDPQEGYRQLLCLARNKTANNITVAWDVKTGSRVRGYAYVEVHWKIHSAGCHPCRQILTVVQNISETCHVTKKKDVVKTWTENRMMEITIRGLLPNAMYNVTLTVTCENQPGTYRKSELKSTAESVPTAPPMNVKAKKARSNYLIFKWEEPPCEYMNGKITNYDFIFEKNGYQIHNVTPADRKFVVFNGMQSTDSYSFKVRANTKRGFGKYSDPERGYFKDLSPSSSASSD